MHARRGTVLNIRVVDDWVMSISGCKVGHDAVNTLSVIVGVMSIGTARCVEHSVMTGALSISGCKARHVVFGHSAW